MSHTKMRTKNKTPPQHRRRPSQEAISSIRKLSTISEDAITPLNEPFQDESADLVLIASDGLGFRVHLSKLTGCSHIFRTTLKPTSLLTPPPSPGSSFHNSPFRTSTSNEIPEIHFTDPSENGVTISLFLHLIYSLKLPIPSLPVYFKAYETLVSFLKKWECHSLFVRLGDSLRGWIEEGYISSSKGFKIGDSLGSDVLLVESIRRSGEYTWSGRVIPDPARSKMGDGGKDASNLDIAGQSNISPTNSIIPNKTPQAEPRFDILRDGLPGESSLNLTAVPYEYFIYLSDEVKFALLRASRVGIVREKEQVDWEKVGDEFQRVLKELRRAR